MSDISPAAQPSPITRLLVSGFILVIALGGVFMNFLLISGGMAEVMVGDAQIGSFSVAQIAALVIVAVELNMGVFLMESLHVTRLVQGIGILPKGLRGQFTGISLTIVIALAATQVGLVYMAELVPQRGAAPHFPPAEWPLAGKLGLALILPLALAFVAIPLNAFVNALRALLAGNRDQHPAGQVETVETQMDPATPAIQPSPSIELAVSGIALIVAVGGMSMNFFALSGALTDTTAGSFRIGGFSGAQISALLAIFAEITLGAVILDSWRVTRLLPAIGSLPKSYRTLLSVMSLACLIALAASEFYLVHMAGPWYGTGPRYPLAEWLPLTFVPLALAFVAIPLDSFVNALRVLMGTDPAANRSGK